MDTVTESAMAIAMAMCGGMGVIHRGKHFGKNPEAQAAEIYRVKNHLNIRIDKPVTVNENDTVEAVLAKIDHDQLNFRSFPVEDDDKKLKGLLTSNHFELCEDVKKKVKDIMTPRDKMIVGSPETTVTEAARLMRENEKGVLPLVSADNILVGMYVASDIRRATQGPGSCNLDARGHLVVGAAIGSGNITFELERARLFIAAGVDAIFIDSSHGHSKNNLIMVEHLKSLYPHIDIIAGNIVSAEAARAFADRGIDGLKVGIGGGSICSTGEVGGVRRPQLSAIESVTREIRDEGIPVCSDGGKRSSGDIVKALAAGAAYVMLGKMLAGATESAAELLEGGLLKRYRGMASLEAMREGSAEDRYHQNETAQAKRVPEGVSGTVPHLGPLMGVLDELVGGIMIGMGLAGAATIEALHNTADFDRVTHAGNIESHPHDVTIISSKR
jgi:IMP dehydrogenase